MHQLILITAMSATTGLFGGGKHCGGKVHHGRSVSSCSAMSYPAPAPCGVPAPHPMPQASYPGSPAMAPAVPPAPASVPAAPTVPAAAPVPTAPPAASFAPAGRTFVYQAAYGPASAR